MKQLLSLFLILALLLTGCSWREPDYLPPEDILLEEGETAPPPTTPSVRELTLVYNPNESMNPYHCSDYTNRVLFSLMYQGLFAVDSAYKTAPILCKSYSYTADMRTWTFQIADATFSDGTAVTAEDVQASLKNAIGSAWYANRLQHVKSISVSEDTVVIQLDTPYENLPILLDIPIVKASQVDAANPIGSGPYSFDGARLRRQADWWCNAALPVSAQTIPLVAAQSPKQIRDSFEASEISLVCTDPGSLDYVDYRSDYELWDCENGLFVYMICNKKSKSALLQNDAVRAALTHGINREALTGIYRSFAQGVTLPASPKSPYYDTKLAERFGYDPKILTDAVAAAQASSNELILMVSAADMYRRQCAQAIAKMLGECGLSVTVKTVTPEKLVDQLRWGEYDLFLGQTRLSANMDLSAFFAENGKLSYGGLSDAGIYAMCLEALTNSGNYYTLHKLVMESGKLCPLLFQSYAVYGGRSSLPGLTPARDNLFFYDLGIRMEDALAQA